MDKHALNQVKNVVERLQGDAETAAGWDMLKDLSTLDGQGHRLTIDAGASDIVGAPVVYVHAVAPDFSALTRRQQDVAHALRRGLSNAAIAAELGISVATVKDHVHAVLTRLNLPNRGAIHALSGQATPKG